MLLVPVLCERTGSGVSSSRLMSSVLCSSIAGGWQQEVSALRSERDNFCFVLRSLLFVSEIKCLNFVFV
jgi:hypothetical protein